MKLTDYLTSNIINALSLEPKVKIEATIVSIRSRDFEDGTKAVIYTDYDGKGVVLNQTRLKALIAAFGTNPDNLIGKTITISRGDTTYAGRDVPCVKIEPVVAERIGAERRPAIEVSENAQPLRGGPTDIRSGRGVWGGPPSPPNPDDGQSSSEPQGMETPPPPKDYDGPVELDDQIPF